MLSVCATAYDLIIYSIYANIVRLNPQHQSRVDPHQDPRGKYVKFELFWKIVRYIVGILAIAGIPLGYFKMAEAVNRNQEIIDGNAQPIQITDQASFWLFFILGCIAVLALVVVLYIWPPRVPRMFQRRSSEDELMLKT